MKQTFFWLKNRAVQTPAYDSKLKMIILSLWLFTVLSVIIAGLATPTGFGAQVDLLVYIALNTILFILSAGIIGFVLSMIYVPLPRMFIGSLAYFVYINHYILSEANLGTVFSWIVIGAYFLVAFCVGIILTVIRTNRLSLMNKGLVSLVPAAIILFILFWSPTIDQHEVEPSFSEDDGVSPLAVENPAEEGDYEVKTFSYGNGSDNHRSEFKHPDVVSNSVDASEYTNEWERFRKFFWDFDETSFPLNGRVWMPEGDERFPVLLMVHGNHRMENFSDEGYEYLGELLASRGYIAVSVDQNFLNFSNWTKTPNNDYFLRAWILLHHLVQIDEFSENSDTPFFEKVDMQRVAVMGHSRGGQAAAMVGDYERWFSEDEGLARMDNIDVQAVIGVAPTDNQVDDMRAELRDVSYLTIHGARDGDVHNYHGDRQYSRTWVDETDHFKAGVYVAEANHSQFNTDWGHMDMRLPGGLFLNRSQMMSAEEQQEVAKVYISAFLESTLGGNEEYVPLFRDIRHGSEWLPNTQYVTRFESDAFHPLVDYNSANDKTELDDGIRAEGLGFDTWEIESAVNRGGSTKRKQGMVFEWAESGNYSLFLPEEYSQEFLTASYDSFVLSMANMENEEDEFPDVPNVDVTFETTDGESATVPLENFRDVTSAIYTQFTRNKYADELMREGKYENATEPVFQTYEIPLHYFEEINPDFQVEELERITVSFSGGPGRFMVDDIGFFEE
ncbi:poly(ethylene terephthalate) hydrolase family protein [Salipaludibacillus keqinensis]|nr:alpha/beta hydrolase [Salipaludibacillus keqinensis]